MGPNESGLSSGLQAISDVVARVEAAGIPSGRIILAGFSQGACLASEYTARHARRIVSRVMADPGPQVGPRSG